MVQRQLNEFAPSVCHVAGWPCLASDVQPCDRPRTNRTQPREEAAFRARTGGVYPGSTTARIALYVIAMLGLGGDELGRSQLINQSG